MSDHEPLDAEQFAAAEGVADWRVVDGFARAVFSTGSFAAGVRLVQAIGAAADAANHHPDVLLTYPRVAVRLVTHDADGLTTADVALAREISGLAAEQGAAADVEAIAAW